MSSFISSYSSEKNGRKLMLCGSERINISSISYNFQMKYIRPIKSNLNEIKVD